MISDWSDFFLQLLWSWILITLWNIKQKKLISFHLNLADNFENFEL
jgi:hypothetical protein